MTDARTGGQRATDLDERNHIPGESYPVSLLVTGEDTGGRFALVELTQTRGSGAPLHIHTHEDELVYVLEGRVTFYKGGERLDCPTGSHVLLPRGCEHSYQVESNEARLLVMVSPAGLENLYLDLGGPNHAGRPYVEWLVCTAARYGVQITGPGP